MQYALAQHKMHIVNMSVHINNVHFYM